MCVGVNGSSRGGNNSAGGDVWLSGGDLRWTVLETQQRGTQQIVITFALL